MAALCLDTDAQRVADATGTRSRPYPALEQRRLGRYQLVAPIGSGGMAAVYAARPLDEPERLVAVKMMLPHIARDRRFAAMFLDEARIACHIQAPNVVRAYDYGWDNGALYLVMELVHGVSLRELLASARELGQGLAPALAASIIVQAATGLAAAHAACLPDGSPLGVVHRDVSPHNILIGTDGVVRVGDFGVAYAIERLSRSTTGGVKGKPGYVSPEHFDRDGMDQRSDVFSLGAVAWECFTGIPLFRANHPLAQLRQVLSQPITPLDELRPEVGSAVSLVVARALERDLGKRTQNMELLARELSAAAQAVSGLATSQDIRAALESSCVEALRELDRAIAATRASSPANANDIERASAVVRRPRASLASRALIVTATMVGCALAALYPSAPAPDASQRQPRLTPAALAQPALEPVQVQVQDAPAAEVSVPSIAPASPPAPRTRAVSTRRRHKRARRSDRALAQPGARVTQPHSEAGPTLLDVGAFERERKRRAQ